MTTTEPRTIDEADARRIASEWHGGQSTALYAFASSGHIATDLLDEASRELADQARRAVDSPSEADSADLVDLAALVAWIGQQNRRNRLRAALGLVHLDTDDKYASDTDEVGAYPDRWLCLSRSTIDGSFLYTTAPEPLDALAASGHPEFPQDWTPFYLFDLDATDLDEDNDPAAVPFTAELAWTYTIPSEGI